MCKLRFDLLCAVLVCHCTSEPNHNNSFTLWALDVSIVQGYEDHSGEPSVLYVVMDDVVCFYWSGNSTIFFSNSNCPHSSINIPETKPTNAVIVAT